MYLHRIVDVLDVEGWNGNMNTELVLEHGGREQGAVVRPQEIYMSQEKMIHVSIDWIKSVMTGNTNQNDNSESAEPFNYRSTINQNKKV